MSRFRVSARAVLRSTAPSSGHAWIAFLRCVEAHAVLSGTSFTALLARLSTTHDIHPRGRPPTARLQAAVRELQQERATLLQRRAALIAARREAKRAGHRVPRLPELQALEAAHRATGTTRPKLGCWGWRALRTEGLGSPVILALESPHPPVYAHRGAVRIDLRRWAGPLKARAWSEALRLRTPRPWHVVGVLAYQQATTWTTEALSALFPLERAGHGRPGLWVVCPPTAPHIGLPEAVTALARRRRWSLGRIGHDALR